MIHLAKTNGAISVDNNSFELSQSDSNYIFNDEKYYRQSQIPT